MKHQFIAVIVLAGSALFATQAFSFEPAFPRNPKVFAKLDVDSNGSITIEELKPKAEKRMLRLDTDKNNEVTAVEIDVYLQKRLEQQRNRMLVSMDADKNGAITVAELDKFIEAMFYDADANKDGGVNPQEARDYRIAKIRKTPAKATAN